MKTDLECIYLFSRQQPDKLAIVHENDEINYKNLWNGIVNFCNYLIDKGFKKNYYVILKAKKASSHIVAFYGIQLAGGIPVILSDNMSVDAILEVANKYEINWIIIDDDVNNENFNVVYHKNVIISNQELSTELTPVFPSLDFISEIIFSSGTTGTAKGVLVTHKNIISVGQSSIKELGISEDHVSMITIPVESVGPLRELHFTMQRGSTLVVAGSMLNLNNYFELIKKYKVTGLYLTPYAWGVILQIAYNEIIKYQKQIRVISSAASPLPEITRKQLIEVLPYSRLFHFYSTTEFGLVSIMEYNAVTEKKDCSGFVRNSMQVRIVDDNFCDVPVGEKGIITVKGESVCPGYFKAPELDKNYFIDDGWMLSGDIGYLDKDNYLYIYGRRDDIIIFSGYKIAPTMIEDIAMQCDLLKECVCIAYNNKETGMEGLKLLIVPVEKKEELAKKILLREMKKKLKDTSAADYALIKVAIFRIFIIETIDAIPRGKNGKIDRKSLR